MNEQKRQETDGNPNCFVDLIICRTYKKYHIDNQHKHHMKNKFGICTRKDLRVCYTGIAVSLTVICCGVRMTRMRLHRHYHLISVWCSVLRKIVRNWQPLHVSALLSISLSLTLIVFLASSLKLVRNPCSWHTTSWCIRTLRILHKGLVDATWIVLNIVYTLWRILQWCVNEAFWALIAFSGGSYRISHGRCTSILVINVDDVFWSIFSLCWGDCDFNVWCRQLDQSVKNRSLCWKTVPSKNSLLEQMLHLIERCASHLPSCSPTSFSLTVGSPSRIGY